MLKKLIVYSVIFSQSMSGIAWGMMEVERPTSPDIAGARPEAGIAPKESALSAEWGKMNSDQQAKAAQQYQEQLQEQAQQKKQAPPAALTPQSLTPEQQADAYALYTYNQTPLEQRPELSVDVLDRVPDATLQQDFNLKNFTPDDLGGLDPKVYNKLSRETQQDIVKRTGYLQPPEQAPESTLKPTKTLTPAEQKQAEQRVKKRQQQTMTKQQATAAKTQIFRRDARISERTENQNQNLSTPLGQTAQKNKVAKINERIAQSTKAFNTFGNSTDKLINNTNAVLNDYKSLFDASVMPFLGWDMFQYNSIPDFKENYDDLINFAQTIRDINQTIQTSIPEDALGKKLTLLLKNPDKKNLSPDEKTFKDLKETLDTVTQWFSGQEQELSTLDHNAQMTAYKALQIFKPERVDLTDKFIPMILEDLKTVKLTDLARLKNDLVESYKLIFRNWNTFKDTVDADAWLKKQVTALDALSPDVTLDIYKAMRDSAPTEQLKSKIATATISMLNKQLRTTKGAQVDQFKNSLIENYTFLFRNWDELKPDNPSIWFEQQKKDLDGLDPQVSLAIYEGIRDVTPAEMKAKVISSIISIIDKLLKKASAKQLPTLKDDLIENYKLLFNNDNWDRFKTSTDASQWLDRQDTYLSAFDLDARLEVYQAMQKAAPREISSRFTREIIKIHEQQLKDVSKITDRTLRDKTTQALNEALSKDYKQLLLNIDEIKTPEEVRAVMDQYSRYTQSLTDRLQRDISLATGDLKRKLWDKYYAYIVDEMTVDSLFGDPAKMAKQAVNALGFVAKQTGYDNFQLQSDIRNLASALSTGDELAFDTNEFSLGNSTRKNLWRVPDLDSQSFRSNYIPFGDISSIESDASRKLLDEVLNNLQTAKVSDPDLKAALEGKAVNLAYEMIKSRKTALEFYKKALDDTPFDAVEMRNKLTALIKKLSDNTKQLQNNKKYKTYLEQTSKSESEIKQEIEDEVIKRSDELAAQNLTASPEFLQQYDARKNIQERKSKMLKFYSKSIPIIVALFSFLSTIIAVTAEQEKNSSSGSAFDTFSF